MSPPNNQFHAFMCGMRPAMEMMLTGQAMDGHEAVRVGFANRAFPAADLERGRSRRPSAWRRSRAMFAWFREGVSKALDTRDGAFGDYRTGRKDKL